MHGRWDKGYEACRLEDIPHKRLTRPAAVFEFCFQGLRKTRGRENILKLQVLQPGLLNAVAFWFDLHLDDQAVLTTGTCTAECLISSQHMCMS